MRRLFFPLALVQIVSIGYASPQYSARLSAPAKVPGISTASSQAGFAGGADDCNSAHPALSGNVAGEPFTTGTTGTTGQNEGICLFFGLTGVTNDVWYNWTSNMTGNASLSTCGATAVDTKVAIYPLSVCPANGTAIACNDDACGLQTGVGWAITSGTTYTIQVGCFPGAAGGSGTFSITQTGPPPCGQKDDGTTENSLGLTAGGEMGWITFWNTSCMPTIDSVETAYGTLMFPGSVTNGAASKVVVYEDDSFDLDPTTGLTVSVKVNTVVVNGDTDLLNKVPLGTSVHRTPPFWYPTCVLVSADHVAGQFPGPMDQTPPTHAAGAWVVGSTLGPGTLNTTNLNANDVAPLNMAAIGFPANWLSRIDNTDGTPTGTSVCFGDGTGTACPCLNNGGPGEGCANGTGGGGVLSASGNASVSNDTMSLTANGVINNNGLFFQGNSTIGGGSGTTFGDGIRCCGGGVVRIQVVNPPGSTSPATAQMTETATTNGPNGTIVAGGKKCYQFWYRDPATSPCGAQFNLTNAVTITWQP